MAVISKASIHIFSFIFAIFHTFLLPTVLLLLIPVFLIRGLVYLLKFVFRPNLDKMVRPRSSLLALDSWTKDPKWNLCVWLTLEGNVDLDFFKQNFYQNAVLKKKEDGVTLLDPEYQQFYSKWLGFVFWEWEEEFNIDEHMKTHGKAERFSEGELKDLIKKLSWTPWKDKKSPWEFLLINNYDSTTDGNPTFPKTVIIFRVHHGLCDGTKILRLLLQDLNTVCINTVQKPKYARDKNTRWQSLVPLLKFPFYAPYQMMEMILTCQDKNVWHSREESKAPFNLSYTPRIPLKFINEIKNYYKVSFTAVVMAAVAGGIRRTMERLQLDIPETMSTVSPVPIPGHSNRLQNHFVIAFYNLPIRTPSPFERMMTIDRTLEAHKTSYINQYMHYFIPIHHRLFSWMVKPCGSNGLSTILFSNFAGPRDVLDFKAVGSHQDMTDVNFSGGTGIGKVGLAFGMLSYNQGMRIMTQADPTILSTDSDLEQLNKDILDELDCLHKPYMI